MYTISKIEWMDRKYHKNLLCRIYHRHHVCRANCNIKRGLIVLRLFVMANIRSENAMTVQSVFGTDDNVVHRSSCRTVSRETL